MAVRRRNGDVSENRKKLRAAAVFCRDEGKMAGGLLKAGHVFLTADEMLPEFRTRRRQSIPLRPAYFYFIAA
jgi:hypothetical protein